MSLIIRIQEFISDQLQFDIMLCSGVFLAFDIFYWTLGIYHRPHSIDYCLGPFILTIEADMEDGHTEE